MNETEERNNEGQTDKQTEKRKKTDEQMRRKEVEVKKTQMDRQTG